MKALSELTEREVLALAIASEEEDSRIYRYMRHARIPASGRPRAASGAPPCLGRSACRDESRAGRPD